MLTWAIVSLLKSIMQKGDTLSNEQGFVLSIAICADAIVAVLAILFISGTVV